MGREIIQNSFDASALEDKPVKVNFKYVSHENVTPEAKEFFDTILDDLKSNWKPSPLKKFYQSHLKIILI